MKKRILLTVLLTLMVTALFAFGVSAASYTVNYGGKATAQTDENGVITLRDTTINNLNTKEYTIKDANGNDMVVTQQFLGWYADDGSTFAPGETVTLTGDIYLRQASGAVVYDYNGLNELLGRDGWYVKLGADITTSSQVSTERTGNGNLCVLDMNGHNFTSSSNYAFGAARSGVKFLGEGKITHTGKGGLFTTSRHSSYDGDQRVYIGKNVTVETTGSLFYSSNDLHMTNNIPEVKIWGKTTSSVIANVAQCQNGLVEIFDGADVTLTGNTLVSNRSSVNEFQIYINIYGGKLTVVEDFAWIDSVTKYDVSMTGGSCNVVPANVFLTNGYEAVLNEETGYYDVVYTACTVSPDGEHKYVEAEGYTDINCLDGRLQYFRCECGAYYIDNVALMGHDYSIITNESQATPDKLGVNKVTCARCGDYYTYEFAFSPTNVEISITVQTENGLVTSTFIASDIYDLTIKDEQGAFSCTINTLKDFIINGVTYTKNDIVIATIPSGTTNIDVGVFDGMQNLKEVVVMDRSNVSFVKNNFKDCPLLEKLTVGACDVVFAQGTNENTSASIFNNCPSLTVIDITKANATFDKYSFASDKTIKHLLMGEGNTYIFREDAFRHSVLEEVIIPDNSNVTLDKKCFAETLTIKYIYVGSYSIASGCIGGGSNTSIFGGNSYLSKLVLMEGINTLEKWVISTKDPGQLYGPLCDLTVYVHSENFKINNSGSDAAFNGRKGNYKVILYVADADFTISSTSAYNFVLYKGIGHAYEQNVITPSNCTIPGTFGWAAKGCDCGIDYRGIAYTSVSNVDNSLNNVTHEPFSTEESDLPLSTEHIMGTTVADVIYDNYFENGTIYYFCKDCGIAQIAEEAPSAEPMMYSAGYSVFEANSLGGICYSVKVNHSAIDFYEINTGKEFAYGLVVSTHNDGAPVIGKDEPQAGAVMADMTKTDFIMLQIKISGIKTENASSEINVCAYAIQDDKIRYLSDKKTYDKAEALTYASIKALTQN